MAKEGTFLGKDFVTLLDELASVPEEKMREAGWEYMEHIDYGENGAGGVVLGQFRKLPETGPRHYAVHGMGVISEIRVPQHALDIRVVISMQAEELVQVPGGERYHGYFREPRGAYAPPCPEAEKFDWAKGLKALNELALNTYLQGEQEAEILKTEGAVNGAVGAEEGIPVVGKTGDKACSFGKSAGPQIPGPRRGGEATGPGPAGARAVVFRAGGDASGWPGAQALRACGGDAAARGSL